jgi:hypothetical protein
VFYLVFAFVDEKLELIVLIVFVFWREFKAGNNHGFEILFLLGLVLEVGD